MSGSDSLQTFLTLSDSPFVIARNGLDRRGPESAETRLTCAPLRRGRLADSRGRLVLAVTKGLGLKPGTLVHHARVSPMGSQNDGWQTTQVID